MEADLTLRFTWPPFEKATKRRRRRRKRKGRQSEEEGIINASKLKAYSKESKIIRLPVLLAHSPQFLIYSDLIYR